MDSDPRRDELEELLRRTSPHPQPSRELRRRARQALVEGQLAAESQDPVQDPQVLAESGSRPAQEQRTSEHLNTGIEHRLALQPLAPAAAPDFRDRLRKTFVEGSWDGAPEEVQPGRAPLPSPEPWREDPRDAPGGRLLRRLMPFAAAAAIILIALLPGEPRWQVEFEGEGTVRIDDVPFGSGTEQRLASILGQSARLETVDTALTLSLETGVEVRILPGTRLTMNPLDGDSPLYLGLELGEIYVATHPDYEGNGINVGSDLGRLSVTGTSLGVLRNEAGLCICVSEGIVKAIAQRHPQDDWREVKAEYRFFVPADSNLGDLLEPQDKDAHFESLREFTQNAFR